MFINSLVILINGWNENVTRVFHFLNFKKLGLTKVARELMILAVFFTCAYGQKLSDEEREFIKNFKK